MKSIVQKYRKMLLESNYERHKASVLIQNTEEDNLIRLSDGSVKFADIDYESADRAIWKPYSHISRIETLLLSGDDNLKPLAISLLKFWLLNDFNCPNWWYNEIGVPMQLADIAVILYGQLDKELLGLLYERILRGVVTPKTDRSRNVYTGANLLWFSSTTMAYALLTENEELLRYITDVAAKETAESKEGLQSDSSFFQHGPRLYSAGYGRSFVTSIVPMMHVLDSTEFAFPEYALDNLARHVLDGLRYMMHRGYYDYVAVGREYVRHNALSARGLLRSAKILLSLEGFKRKDELAALIKSIENAEPAFEGVRYFPVSALLTMSLGGVYFSYKGVTPEIYDAEIINDENRLGYNLSYGTHTTVMQSGKEYENIAPIWDYSKIPGTTAPYMTDAELLAVPDFSKRAIKTSDYGGWCEGDIGAIYMTTIHEGISVTVSAFATPYGLVVLGNSINDEAERALTTTAEQCHALFPVSEDCGDIFNGSVKYRSLDEKAPLVYSVGKSVGNWNRNRPSEPERAAEGEVLTVTVKAEKNYNKYAYVIAPASANLDGLSVLKNEKLEQEIILPDGRKLSARKNEDI